MGQRQSEGERRRRQVPPIQSRLNLAACFAFVHSAYIFARFMARSGSHRRRDAPGTRKSETPARGAGVSAAVPGHPQWLSRLNGNVQKCVAEQVGFLK
ncbi:hypothetical protein GAY30_27760 [Azospirillum brasilense]|nr:hypothetical protein [Azospirillum brasilense]NUB35343.1 hypothetical protein [Azospirillum brasilense]